MHGAQAMLKSIFIREDPLKAYREREALSPENRVVTVASREEIAVGGTSLVYRTIFSNGRREIEKVLIPKYHGQFDYEMLPQTEDRILRSLNHPLIVKSFGVTAQRTIWNTSTHFLYLEYVDGIPLSQVYGFVQTLDDERRERWAVEFLNQATSILHHLIQTSVVHGDFAPDNILVQKNGFIKLIDFGVSRRFADPQHPFKVAGRRRFRAPELSETGHTSFEGDIYALGKIYDDLLGDDLSQKPVHQETLQELLVRRLLPDVQVPATGWYRGFLDLPNAEEFEVVGRPRVKTKLKTILAPRGLWGTRFSPAYFAFLLGLLPFMSSFMPQVAEISVNTWPVSYFSVDRLGESTMYETPRLRMKVPWGNVTVRFEVPSMNHKVIVRKVKVMPGDHVKLFEDFRNIGSLAE